MLIRVKPNRSDNIRHRSGWIKQNDESRMVMRSGIGKTALRARWSGRKEVDCMGRPLYFANVAAEHHSHKTLEQWAKKRRTSYSIPRSNQEDVIVPLDESVESSGRKRYVAVGGQWVRVE